MAIGRHTTLSITDYCCTLYSIYCCCYHLAYICALFLVFHGLSLWCIVYTRYIPGTKHDLKCSYIYWCSQWLFLVFDDSLEVLYDTNYSNIDLCILRVLLLQLLLFLYCCDGVIDDCWSDHVIPEAGSQEELPTSFIFFSRNGAKGDPVQHPGHVLRRYIYYQVCVI